MEERTFAFADLAGFTAFAETHGDSRAVSVIDTFEGIVRARLAAGDQLVKCLGDAVMLAFLSPDRAIRALKTMLADLAELDQFPLVRSGMHHGPAVERADDWLGATVNLTARVAAEAGSNQTFCTSAVAEAARLLGVPTTALGSFRLRHISQPVELFELSLLPIDEASSVDPVCHMPVRHVPAAVCLRTGGEVHWFCSFECLAIYATREAPPSR